MGKVTGKVRENTCTITIMAGVTGKILFCKNSGTIDNQGELTYDVDPDDPFCAPEAPKPTPKPAPQSPPKAFFCLNAAKHAKKVFRTAEESTSGEVELCSEVARNLKIYFDAFRHEMESPDAKKFFAKCCDVPPTPPKGKKYILKKMIIKRKRLKAKTTVNLDFLDSNNKDQRNKFEAAFIKRAKAKSGTFTYKKVAKSNRRHLTQGTETTKKAVVLLSTGSL